MPAQTEVSGADTPSAVAQAHDPLKPSPNLPPRFDTFRLSKEGAAVVAGMAPGARRVAIVMDGVEVTAVDVTSSGGFAAVFDIVPSPDPRMMTLRAVYADATELASSESIVVAPLVSATALAVEGREDADPARQASLPPSLTLADTAAPPVVAQPANLLLSGGGVKVLRPNIDGALTIDIIAYGESGLVEVGGRGDSGQILRLYLDNQLQFETLISGQGDWAGALPDVVPGLYALRADVIDPSGKVTARSETPFLREAPDAVQMGTHAPAVQMVTVQPGYTLWGIAEQTYGEGKSYVAVFEANREQIRNPDLIYPGQIFALPKGAN